MASSLLDAWGPRNRPLVVALIANLKTALDCRRQGIMT